MTAKLWIIPVVAIIVIVIVFTLVIFGSIMIAKSKKNKEVATNEKKLEGAGLSKVKLFIMCRKIPDKILKKSSDFNKLVSSLSKDQLKCILDLLGIEDEDFEIVNSISSKMKLAKICTKIPDIIVNKLPEVRHLLLNMSDSQISQIMYTFDIDEETIKSLKEIPE